MSSAGEPLDSAPLERSAQLLLLASVFIVASCGMVYQNPRPTAQRPT